jgi:hypothetical protein
MPENSKPHQPTSKHFGWEYSNHPGVGCRTDRARPRTVRVGLPPGVVDIQGARTSRRRGDRGAEALIRAENTGRTPLSVVATEDVHTRLVAR